MKIEDFIRKLVDIINKKIERNLNKLIFIGQVIALTPTEEGEYTIEVVRLSDGVRMKNVRIVGLGLGNLRGVVKYPQQQDIGLVISLFGERFWLGNIFDRYSSKKDSILPLGKGLLIQSQEAGSYILFTNKDNIEIKQKDGMKIIFKKDRIRIKNSESYGIEVTSDGKVNIYGVEVNFYNTPMD